MILVIADNSPRVLIRFVKLHTRRLGARIGSSEETSVSVFQFFPSFLFSLVFSIHPPVHLSVHLSLSILSSIVL